MDTLLATRGRPRFFEIWRTRARRWKFRSLLVRRIWIYVLVIDDRAMAPTKESRTEGFLEDLSGPVCGKPDDSDLADAGA
jgi:hypothetical protein